MARWQAVWRDDGSYGEMTGGAKLAGFVASWWVMLKRRVGMMADVDYKVNQ